MSSASCQDTDKTLFNSIPQRFCDVDVVSKDEEIEDRKQSTVFIFTIPVLGNFNDTG